MELWIRAFSDLAVAWSGGLRQLKLSGYRSGVLRPPDRHHACYDGFSGRARGAEETGSATGIFSLHAGNSESQE